MVKSKVLKQLRKSIEKAYKIENPLLHTAADSAWQTVSLADTEIQILWYTTLPTLLFEQCCQIFEQNMKDYYQNSSWGYNQEEKQQELAHKNARYLVLQKNNDIAAFVHLRFEFDDEDDPSCAVLYVYELQVAAPYQRQGLGVYLMQIAEALAETLALEKVMLTCFLSNKQAMSFYVDKLGYRIDITSPSMHNVSADYEILSKSVIMPK